MISVFDLFKIGIGPSSSHTVGPMKAARQFVVSILETQPIDRLHAVKVELFGSLGATGKGHGTDKAVLLGLEGETPELIDPETIEPMLTRIRTQGELHLLGKKSIAFHEPDHLLFHWQPLPFHPNGMRFTASDATGQEIAREVFYSVGGGFIVNEKEIQAESTPDKKVIFPYPFKKAIDLLTLCQQHHLSISQLMMANEKTLRSEEQIREGLFQIWNVMQQCVQKGCNHEGVLPGGLNVKRRAPELYRQLAKNVNCDANDPLQIIDWVNLFAIAVNEENAAGGRVVTAPTNGAAGIIPAVLHYYDRFCPHATPDRIIDFLLTAGAIGILYKENASISGADVGCQGEVGVACSMAAGALAEILGGTSQQVENAAEIAMEHNLGLTCDPIAGLVQIPCIERNAIGAVKAINAARMALRGDGQHFVSLDKVIQTMRATGADMHSKYKETSRGGLAVNVIEC
ncbi:MAG: L-serine ammonia-lyase [Cyanobacteria bacterium RU_5_0]|nr:L-serine ammonia-lyase [Cyanobacteria bacterium RU_5_0]